MKHLCIRTSSRGNRNAEVIEALKKYKGVYFQTTGGAAALVAKAIVKATVIAYEELGPEAIQRLEVKNFPTIVVNDCHGGDLFASEIAKYRRE